MAKRVQVILDVTEKEVIKQQARLEKMSVSAWIRKAALREVEERRKNQSFRSPNALRFFFQACDEREKGSEPDWEEHKELIERSARSGESGT